AASCFVVLAAWPIRYWPLIDNLDGTWVFVLNYAAAHGLKVGSDVFFTYGPLAYLTFPQAFGSNLAQGLIFQACLWLLLARELECLFFRSNLPLRNLALFSFFIALSTPLYCFNFGGVENLILLITLVELYLYRLRGSFRHYMFALVFIGITSLIKLSACLMAAAGLAGFLTDRVIQDGWKAKREIAAGPASAGSHRRWSNLSGAVWMASCIPLPARCRGHDRGVHRSHVRSGPLLGTHGGRGGSGSVPFFSVTSGERQSRLGQVFHLHLRRARAAVVQAWLRAAGYSRHQLLRFY